MPQGYSQQFPLAISGGPTDTITKGKYQFIIHAPSWAPNFAVQVMAAITEALQGDPDTANKIIFGTYKEIETSGHAAGELVYSDGDLTKLQEPHKDLIWDWEVKEDIGGWMLIVGLILVVLIIFGLLWIVLTLAKAGVLPTTMLALLLIAAFLLMSEAPKAVEKAKPYVKKAPEYAKKAVRGAKEVYKAAKEEWRKS